MFNDAVGRRNIWILLVCAVAGSYELYALLLLSILKIKTGKIRLNSSEQPILKLLDYCVIPTTAVFE